MPHKQMMKVFPNFYAFVLSQNLMHACCVTFSMCGYKKYIICSI